jgi:hypothetical protein
VIYSIQNISLYTGNNRLIRSENRIKNMKGAEHPIGESDQEYKMGGALPVKYSEYFDAKRHESLKNENIRYDTFSFQLVLTNLFHLCINNKFLVLTNQY